MKTMSFNVAVTYEVAATAILKGCKFNGQVIEFESPEIASAMFEALQDGQFDTSLLFVEGSCIGSPSIMVEIKESSDYIKAVEIIWYENKFNHIQYTEGIGPWLRPHRKSHNNL